MDIHQQPTTNNQQPTTNNQQPFLTVPLLSSDREIAKQFAAEQATPEKGVQVYLNTLSVLAVNRYLNWLQIDTDVTQSDCWNAGLRAMFDVADLRLSNGRQIECRFLRSPARNIILPAEVRRDRIGVMAIQLGESFAEVKLLGFFPTHSELPAEIDLEDFQDLDVFLEELEGIGQTVPLVCLREWLQDIFTEGWEEIANFISPQTPTLAFRKGTIQRCKLLDFDLPLLFSISLDRDREEKLKICLQLRPLESEQYLPLQLKFRVLTKEGTLFREIIARDRDRFIQYEFRGNFGEEFSLKIVSQDRECAEYFRV
ncbi:MAG: DUF1822 family protein [Spirulina sp.]